MSRDHRRPGRTRRPGRRPARRPDIPRPPRLPRLLRLPDRWLALAALAALLAVAYGNVVFGGRSLVFSNGLNPFERLFTAMDYGPDFVPLSVWEDRNLLTTPNFHDVGGPTWQWEPDAEFVRHGLARGELPFWNPYVGAGAPEMASLAPAVAFPPYLAMVALGDTVALRNAYQLLVLLAAGWLAYLFLRRHDLSPLPALLGAAAFLFSGALTQNVGSFHAQATATMPLALYLVRRFLDRPSAREAALLAAGLATAALASFPPVLAASFGFAALYALVALWVEPADGDGGEGVAPRRRRLGGLALAAVLGVGLVAFYYLPAFALERAAPQVDRAYAGAARVAVRPVTLLQLTSPSLAGGGEIFRRPPVPEPDVLHLPYAGWLPILLCPLALPPPRDPRDRRRALRAAAWIGLALLLAKLLGLPPVQWIGYLPGIEHMHIAHYFGDLGDLLVALLAALGAERLARGEVGLPLAAAAGGAGLLLVGAVRWVAAVQGIAGRLWASQWMAEWRLMAAIAAVAALLMAWGARQSREGIGSRRGRVALLALFAVFAVEAVAHTYYPRPRAFDVWRHPPDYVRAVSRLAGDRRVFSAAAFPANAGGVYGVFQLDSLLAFNAPRVFDLYHRYVAPAQPLFLRGAGRIPPEGVLDRAAIGLLVFALDARPLLAEAERRHYEVVFADDYARVFARRGSPHYFFSSDVLVVGAAEQALDAVGRLPAGRRVVLERPPSFAAAPNRPDDPPVAVVRFGLNGYRLQVDAPRPGLVYSADSLLPGWTARVGGRPAPILPANYAFRAVEVPAGRSEIELAYWPPGLTAGLAASGLAAAGVAALLVWPLGWPVRRPASGGSEPGSGIA